jgi:hypothetical protein
MKQRDHSLDTLLLLDGETFVADDEGRYLVRFVAKQVEASPERPHGLNYSLTLHDRSGERLLGFDNAHGISEGSGPGARTRIEYDHKHAGERVRFYEFSDAATLLADFWTEVEVILQRRAGE